MSAEKPKPQIIPLPNGPLYFFTDFTPHPVAGLRGEEGQTYAAPKAPPCAAAGAPPTSFLRRLPRGAALQRAQGERRPPGPAQELPGQRIVIHDNRHVCSTRAFASTSCQGSSTVAPAPGSIRTGRRWRPSSRCDRKVPLRALSYSLEGGGAPRPGAGAPGRRHQGWALLLVGGVEVGGHEPRPRRSPASTAPCAAAAARATSPSETATPGDRLQGPGLEAQAPRNQWRGRGGLCPWSLCPSEGRAGPGLDLARAVQFYAQVLAHLDAQRPQGLVHVGQEKGQADDKADEEPMKRLAPGWVSTAQRRRWRKGQDYQTHREDGQGGEDHRQAHEVQRR